MAAPERKTITVKESVGNPSLWELSKLSPKSKRTTTSASIVTREAVTNAVLRCTCGHMLDVPLSTPYNAPLELIAANHMNTATNGIHANVVSPPGSPRCAHTSRPTNHRKTANDGDTHVANAIGRPGRNKDSRDFSEA